MDGTLLLFAGDCETELRGLQRDVESERYRTRFVRTATDIGDAIRSAGQAIVVLQYGDDGEAVATCREIRSEFRLAPVQILLIGCTETTLQDAIDAGVDDFLVRPIRVLELECRIRAASIRLRSQVRLLEERDFFRNAAKQEEELSSRLLDQHLVLKEAFRNIEDLNRELEATNHKLERIARYDILSGLLNRMSLFNVMDMEIERALRTKLPLSGIMLDVDNFKEINDNYGHLCGDEVIRHIGKRLRMHLRKYDQAGRYGGEEFFAVLPNTNLRQAFMIAERFRSELARSRIEIDDETIAATASFGIAEYRHGESRENWIARSDRNMYAAKQSGRNRVVAE